MIRLGIDARVVQDRPSGLVSYTKNLIKKLIQNDSFELFIFGQKKYQAVFAEFLSKKNVHFVPVYYDPYFLSFKNFLYECLFLHRIIHDQHLDLFHNPFGYGLPFFLKNKSILTIHDVIPLYSYDSLTWLQKIIYKKSLVISLARATHVVVISEFTKKDLIQNFPHLPNDFVSVIHNGFDNLLMKITPGQDVYPELKKTYSLPEKYIIYLGSGTDRKNLVRMTEGFILWKNETNAKHKLVLISKFNRPETAISFEKIKKLLSSSGYDEDMVHIQFVKNEAKAALLSHAELLIYPSIYEGFGLPLLEAASCNIPVCCSDIPIFHEVCGDGALYFDPFNSHSISQTIKSCIEDSSLRKRLIQLARERIALFSWDKMTNNYIELYRRIASTQRKK